jgi:hypothetical protein
VSPTPPEIERLPLAGVHLTGLAAVVSVHITIFSAPVKHASLTEAVPSLSVALPVQGAPEDIEKPPIGPHELIVVGGTGGCGATCKHPLAIRPAAASPTIVSLEIELTNVKVLAIANIETIPRIRPPPSAWLHDDRFDPGSRFSLYPLAAIMSCPTGGGETRKKSRVGRCKGTGAARSRALGSRFRSLAYEPFARSPGR